MYQVPTTLLEFYRCPPHYTCIDYDLFLRFFGPNNLPFLQVGLYGSVEVDSGFHVRIADVSRFEHTVRPKTWSAVQHYAADLKKRDVKIAFFSATPQGGGVALMRHALIRLANELGVDMKWYGRVMFLSPSFR